MMNRVKQQLKEFKLSGFCNNLDERLSYAKDNSLSYMDFLSLILEDESNNRADNSYKKRYAQAKLPAYKSIEDFDFTFQPSIDKRLINDGLTCNFIKENKNIVFIGSPGTGKSHLSIAIAINALKKNFKVLFTSVSQLLYSLHTAKADNSYYKKLDYFLKPDLLILDELGFKKIPDYSASDFFEIISRKYEKSSLIITTNKPFEQWSDILDDNVLTSAILDRVIHYSDIININGPSYRSKNMKLIGDKKM